MIPKQGLRLALWKRQGISDRRTQSLVLQVLQLLRANIDILKETNLCSPLNPPWTQWNQMWTTSSRARGNRCRSPIAFFYQYPSNPNRRGWKGNSGNFGARSSSKLRSSRIDVLAGDFNCEVNPSSRSPGSHELWALVQTWASRFPTNKPGLYLQICSEVQLKNR
jgi:hypothetical protein